MQGVPGEQPLLELKAAAFVDPLIVRLQRIFFALSHFEFDGG